MAELDDWANVDDWADHEPAKAAPAAEGIGTRLMKPVTDIPREAYKATADAMSGVNDNLNPFSAAATERRARGEPPSLLSTGKGLLSALSVPFAPVAGAARAAIGHPLAATDELLREGATKIHGADKVAPALGYEGAKDRVDTALAAAAPRGFSPAGARAPNLPAPPVLTPRDEIAAASERLGVPVPLAGATDNLVAQRFGAAAKEIPIVGDPLVKASRRSIEGLGDAAEGVSAQYGSGNVLTAGDAAKTAISDWITGKSKHVLDKLYNKVDPLVNQTATRPLHEVQNSVGDILSRRIASGESSPGKAVDLITEAVTRPGGLTYQGVKDLRTRVGSYLDGSILPEPGTSMPDLKKIYGALTKDLRGTVFDHGGPDALAAFDKANRVASIVSGRREALAKIIGKDAGMAPEGVLDRLAQMASTKSNADITRLGQARKAIGPTAWDEVASAVISRIGRAPDGEFSPDRFVTAFGKLSDGGKQALFGSTGRGDLVRSLDDIATISKRAQQIARFGNPSGTGRTASVMTALGGVWAAPLTTLSGIVSGHVIARALARPITAKATANWSRAYQRAQQQATAPSRRAFDVASANLAKSLGQLGLDPAQVLGGLRGAVPGRADEQQDQ